MADQDLGSNPVRELARRFFITFLLGVVVYRLGVFVPIPGVEFQALNKIIGGDSDGALAAILRYADMFNGGAISNASIFGLGIMPYISASIIMQLLTASFPALKQLQKDGEGGRRKINQYTRYATLGLCVIQSAMAAMALYNFTDGKSGSLVSQDYTQLRFVIQSCLVITTGSMVLLWISEQITKFGIGNGVSIIIMIGILSSIPAAFSGFDGDLGAYLMVLILCVAIIASIVVVVQAVRKIPLEQQRRIQGNRVYGGASTTLPLKLNQANVIPVIFASPVLVVLGYIAAMPLVQAGALMGYGTPGYRYVFAGLIIAFTFFYISITFDLSDLANHFKQAGFFVRGIKPGRKTVEYLQHHLARITFVGAVFLAIIAILPDLIGQSLMGSRGHALMGGTGLLIVVGVSLDVMQKVGSFFLAHQYQGLGGAQEQRSSGTTKALGAMFAGTKKTAKRF